MLDGHLLPASGGGGGRVQSAVGIAGQWLLLLATLLLAPAAVQSANGNGYEFDSPICDRLGYREHGRHVYEYCKYTFGEAGAAHAEEVVRKRKDCVWKTTTVEGQHHGVDSYEQRLDDISYPFNFWDTEMFPQHETKQLELQSCMIETTLGDVYINRTPFVTRKKGSWESIQMHIFKEIDFEKYDFYIKGTQLAATKGDHGEAIGLPYFHFHHIHLDTAFDYINVQLPTFHSTENHGDAACEEGSAATKEQCMWMVHPPGYYQRIDPELMGSNNSEWMYRCVLQSFPDCAVR